VLTFFLSVLSLTSCFECIVTHLFECVVTHLFECVVTHLFECVVTFIIDRLDNSFLCKGPSSISVKLFF
jgi:hypothetical protein